MDHVHLAIDINSVAVRLTKWINRKLVDEKNYTFIEQHVAMYKPQLETFWKDTGWTSADFSDMSLSWSEKETSLVPTSVFNESEKHAIFALSFGHSTPADEVDYNRIALPNVVNVYSIPFWVKSFFVIRFPRILIQHEGTYLLRGLYAQTGKKRKSQIVIHQNHFLIASVEKDEVVFYSTFDWIKEQDIVYYYSFFLQQQASVLSEQHLEISLGAGAKVDVTLLTKLFQEIHQDSISLNIVEHLVEKHQSLCV